MSVYIVCAKCGSEDVCRDAWAVWDAEAQEWVLDNVFDDAYCQKCEETTTLDEVSRVPE